MNLYYSIYKQLTIRIYKSQRYKTKHQLMGLKPIYDFFANVVCSGSY